MVSPEAELWMAHQGALRHFCSGLVGPSDGEDLAAAAFLRCRDALSSGRVDQPRAYLFRTACNLAHNDRRRRSREWSRAIRAMPVEAVQAPEDHRAVRDAVAGLSPRQRAVLYLAYWEDMSEREIAELLDLHPGSVRQHLHRAKSALRKALE